MNEMISEAVCADRKWKRFGKSAVRAVIPLHESVQLSSFFNTVITILLVGVLGRVIMIVLNTQNNHCPSDRWN